MLTASPPPSFASNYKLYQFKLRLKLFGGRLKTTTAFNWQPHLIVQSCPALRISYRVLIESWDLEPFHSNEKYRVSNPQYRVSLILKNCDFFCLFLPEKLYYKAKNTQFGSLKVPDSLPPLFGNNSSKCLIKGHQKNSPKKRLSSNKSLRKGHFWG